MKHFFITGAARGIGAEIARHASQRGHKVTLSDMNGDAVAATASGIERSHSLQLDVRNDEDWRAAIEAAQAEHGPIDVLVNNAGVLFSAPVTDQDFAEIDLMIDVNFRGALKGLRAFAEYFSERGAGHIISLVSQTSYMTPPGIAVYSASKHALRAVQNGLATEMRNSPIKFSQIHPTSVATDMIGSQKDNEHATLLFTPKALSPADVARTVLRASERGGGDYILPSFSGQFARVLGMFPGLQKTLFGKYLDKEETTSSAH